jgi:hypothetical protein
MNQGSKVGTSDEKNGGGKYRATVPLSVCKYSKIFGYLLCESTKWNHFNSFVVVRY